MTTLFCRFLFHSIFIIKYMSILRIYPAKNNLISSGIFGTYNAGQNAVADIFFGGGATDTAPDKRNSYSRFLIKFDLTEFQAKLATKDINQNRIVSIKLKLKNSIPRNAVLDTDFEFDRLSKAIATSYDLIAFPINKDWDEGRGYDLLAEHYAVRQFGNPQITGTSNWFSATTTTAWDAPGVYVNPSASTTFISSQHFDIGDEDMNMDISDIVYNWLSGGSANYGIGIAYRRDYELLSTTTRYISSFYTRHTNTAYKPYIEINYDQFIQDDRPYVTNNRPCKLFLYTFSGNNVGNYYSASTVNVLDSSGNIVHTGLTPTQLSKGVYYIDVFMSAATRGQKYRDVWSGVTFNPGYDVQNITQTFTIQDNFYTTFIPQINQYSLTLYGISNDQILSIGETHRLYCDLAVNYSSMQRTTTPYLLQYRMVMNNQDEVIPWTNVNQAFFANSQKNYLDIETGWLLHNQTYKVQFRVMELGTVRVMDENIAFKVLRSF